jgi:hypothetical protein
MNQKTFLGWEFPTELINFSKFFNLFIHISLVPKQFEMFVTKCVKPVDRNVTAYIIQS